MFYIDAALENKKKILIRCRNISDLFNFVKVKPIKVISIFLLAIYAFVQLHSIIPHIHINDHAHENTIHEHIHTEHHHHAHSEENYLFHFFEDFINNVTHVDLGAEHLDNYFSVSSNVVDFKFLVNLNIALISSILSVNISDTPITLKKEYNNVILYDFLYTNNSELRGPPSIS